MLRAKLTAWLDRHLDPEWRHAHKMLSVQMALVQAVLNGVYSGVYVIQEYVTPLEFIGINVGLSIALLACRLVNQDFDNGAS